MYDLTTKKIKILYFLITWFNTVYTFQYGLD